MQKILAVILLAALPHLAFAFDGPGTLQDALKNAEMKASASQVAAWGFRDGLKEAIKSLEDFPAETCVENSIMASEALMELNSASSCLRAPGFAFEFMKAKPNHCKATSPLLSKITSKAVRDSIRRCMMVGYTQCHVEGVEYVPTTDNYCIVRATTKGSMGADREPIKLVQARDMLTHAHDLMENNHCEHGQKVGEEAKVLLSSIKMSVLPDYPSGRTPAYFCDDF